ncbi:MAG: RDD family protein, partial [Parafilimonas terrae]|nr:RDD family protein [Parafilimonas terrae]
MTYTSTRWTPPGAVVGIGRAGLPAGALSRVRTRRMLAVCLDLIAVSILSFGLWLALLVLT